MQEGGSVGALMIAVHKKSQFVANPASINVTIAVEAHFLLQAL